MINGLSEFSMEVEQASKGELYPGHGVLTGTLQRSIHADVHDYNFRGDDVTPSNSTPERGGKAFQPKIVRLKILAAIGSGMSYALLVHQGWSKFAGYHYIANGLQKKIPEVPGIFQKNVKGD